MEEVSLLPDLVHCYMPVPPYHVRRGIDHVLNSPTSSLIITDSGQNLVHLASANGRGSAVDLRIIR